MRDFPEIEELVRQSQQDPNPDQFMEGLKALDRAMYPDLYAELDATFYDVETPPEEGG